MSPLALLALALLALACSSNRVGVLEVRIGSEIVRRDESVRYLDA
jgi:hypothetical protein